MLRIRLSHIFNNPISDYLYESCMSTPVVSIQRLTTNTPSNHSEKGKDKKLLLSTTTISGIPVKNYIVGMISNMPYLHGMLLSRTFPSTNSDLKSCDIIFHTAYAQRQTIYWRVSPETMDIKHCNLPEAKNKQMTIRLKYEAHHYQLNGGENKLINHFPMFVSIQAVKVQHWFRRYLHQQSLCTRIS